MWTDKPSSSVAEDPGGGGGGEGGGGGRGGVPCDKDYSKEGLSTCASEGNYDQESQDQDQKNNDRDRSSEDETCTEEVLSARESYNQENQDQDQKSHGSTEDQDRKNNDKDGSAEDDSCAKEELKSCESGTSSNRKTQDQDQKNDDKNGSPKDDDCTRGVLSTRGRSDQESQDQESSDSETSQEKCYINCLPREILLYIFSFLTVQELGRSVEPVCSKWRELARDHTIRKSFVFSFQNPVEGDRIKDLLAGAPLLVKLELQSREDGQDLLLHAASFCPKLKKLTVKFCDGLTETVFRLLMENCSDLEYLNVEGSRVCDRECFHYIAGLTHLQHLNLSHCLLLDDLGLMAIAKECRSLWYLDIDGITAIHDTAVVFLAENLCNTLKYLFLDGEWLTDASFKSLRKCTKLLELGVSFCEKMTDQGLSGIVALKHLVWLKLRKGCELTPSGLKSLFQDGAMKHLTHVNLGECSLLDDTVLQAMATCCPNLVHLTLHWCWEVTDDGMSAIITRCPRLKVLDLVGVVQLTGSVFLNVPTALPELLILDLEQCSEVDDALLSIVVSQKPSLRVFDYWGDPVMPIDDSEKVSDMAAT